MPDRALALLGSLRAQLCARLGDAAAYELVVRAGFELGHAATEPDLSLVLAPLARWEEGPLDARAGAPLLTGTLHGSKEVEDQLARAGRAERPVCWLACGLIGGHLSRAQDWPIVCIEERCRARGDAACVVVARGRDEWGATAGADEHAPRRATPSPRRSEIVARSPAMRSVIALARRLGRGGAGVTLVGEGGVGKTAVARVLHAESSRAAGPFVTVECAGGAAPLIEIDLFGLSAPGAAEGLEERAGALELAHRGTLLLDEIDALPPALQERVAHAIRSGEVCRVGSETTRAIDVRLLGASEHALDEARVASALRGLVGGGELRVPPLRERVDDILVMSRVFVAEGAARLGRELRGIAPRAAARLERYDWPGNVRELMNAIERAVMLAEGSRIELVDLPVEVTGLAEAIVDPARSERLEEIERAHILDVVQRSRSKAEAAERLGIGTATLFRKLREYARG